MEFDKVTYFNTLAKKGVFPSLIYLSTIQPKTLYKFFSLETKIDDLKFTTLKENKIWVDLFCNQNDPFEMINLNIDNNTVKEKRNKNGDLIIEKDDLANAYQINLDWYKNTLKFAAFCQTMETNISMWAYYTNNHKGFCCEYEPIERNIKASTVLKPVIYEEKVTKMPSSFVEESLIDFLNDLTGTHEETEQKKLTHLELVKISASTKFVSWEHEKEYRGFYLGEKNGKGENVNCSDLNVRLKAIYSGVNCSEENKKKLKEIAKELSVPFYEMKISPDYFTLIKSPSI